MATEIERKFLVGEVPDFALATESEEIDQGYLVSDGETEIRVRSKGSGCFLTVKKGHGGVREETEIRISRDQFEPLWALTEGWRVSKRRHRIDLDDALTAEMDVYAGRLEGLVTVEVEFGSEEASRSFEPPEWFGRELTGDVRYSNQQMARIGVPD